MFEPERRNQRYHDEACRQKAYRERTRRNEKTLRNALTLPVLSLFPGIGLLDRTFEEVGLWCCVGLVFCGEMTFETSIHNRASLAGSSAGRPARRSADYATLLSITAIRPIRPAGEMYRRFALRFVIRSIGPCSSELADLSRCKKSQRACLFCCLTEQAVLYLLGHRC